MNTATKDDTQIYCKDWGRRRLATMHGTPGPTRCRLAASGVDEPPSHFPRKSIDPDAALVALLRRADAT